MFNLKVAARRPGTLGVALMLVATAGCVCARPFLPSDCATAVAKLRTEPNEPLGLLARWAGWLTTPFKRLGVFGWEDTGCRVERAEGVLVRDGQWSTDGFWTVDVRLSSFTVAGVVASECRFIRLEIHPGTHAHTIAEATPLTTGTRIVFGGPLLVDHDPPGWLEVHPDTDFAVTPPARE